MPHYKNSKGKLFFFESDAEKDLFCTELLEKITDAQAKKRLEPSNIQLKEAKILELKELLKSTDYMVLGDYDAPEPAKLAQRKEWRNQVRALSAEIKSKG
jgi:hypothetical protein